MTLGIDPWSQLSLSFWPSVKEIEESALENAYMAGLNEFYDSVEELRHHLETAWCAASDDDRRNGPRITRHPGGVSDVLSATTANGVPATIITLFMSLGSGGLGAVLFSLLRAWIDKKNGRKLRVKIGEFEIEATQMDEKQFLRFMEIAQTYRDRFEQGIRNNHDLDVDNWREEWREDLLLGKFVLLDQNSLRQNADERAIREAFSASLDKVYKKLRLDGDTGKRKGG